MFYGGDHNFGRKPYLQEREEDRVTLGNLVNSPNRYSNVGYPLRECKQPEVERFYLDFVKKMNPELVHVHSLIGLSGSIIELTRKMGVPVVVSLHNYWFICPRGDFLIPPDYRLCPGPDRGLNCAACLPRQNKLSRNTAYVKDTLKSLLKTNVRLKRRLQKYLMWLNRRRKGLPSGDSDEPAPGNFSAIPEPTGVFGYQFREEYFRHLLSQDTDLIIAVSQAVKRIFVRHGVPQEKIRVLHSGIKATEELERVAAETSRKVRSPIVFGFFGPVQPYKGVHVLIDAFNRLPEGSARLLIFGTGSSNYVSRLMRMAKPGVEFRGAFDDLGKMLAEFDVAVVPPIWEDNAPLVVLESQAAGKPIIGANIGGIPDFVQHNANGLLFKAGDSEDLAKKMGELAASSPLVEYLGQNVKPPRSMQEHAADMEQVYTKLLANQEEMTISEAVETGDVLRV
jgi:glycosyltransferase involved in cell wall biosynthesis